MRGRAARAAARSAGRELRGARPARRARYAGPRRAVAEAEASRVIGLISSARTPAVLLSP